MGPDFAKRAESGYNLAFAKNRPVRMTQSQARCTAALLLGPKTTEGCFIKGRLGNEGRVHALGTSTATQARSKARSQRTEKRHGTRLSSHG
jgi:hypothetical protein